MTSIFINKIDSEIKFFEKNLHMTLKTNVNNDCFCLPVSVVLYSGGLFKIVSHLDVVPFDGQMDFVAHLH